MTIEIYLAETKYAVEQLFTNYLFYHQLGTELSTALRNHKSFVFSPEYNSDPDNPDYEQELARWQVEQTEPSQILSVAVARMKGVEASRNAIAGAILQLAFMGLKIYLKNTIVPAEWQNEYDSLSKGQRKQLKLFAVGRKIWSNTPLGLAIYAGRNQYNHFDDYSKGYSSLVETILHQMGDFNRTELSFDVLPFYDYPQSIASHMIDIIGWKMYEQYSSDIKEAVA